ncbi:hypothetical protein GCM10010452_84630 [Crossiella cryophila]
MLTSSPMPGDLDPDAPFPLHIRFRVPLWRLECGTRRIEAALTQLGLIGLPVAVVLADEFLITVSLSAGTIGQALQGEEAILAGVRSARRLAELLWDLDPRLTATPGEVS